MGIIVCHAKNELGSSEVKAIVYVLEQLEPFTVRIENDPPIVVGDNVSLMCAVSSHKYSNEMKWFRGNGLVERENGEIIFRIALTMNISLKKSNIGRSFWCANNTEANSIYVHEDNPLEFNKQN